MKNGFLTVLACLSTLVANAESLSMEGLFLTWKEDPSSTMTLQWMEKGQLLPASTTGSAAQPYAIPRLGAAEEVREKGFAARFFSDRGERYTDFEGSARLGWTEEGLVIAFEVRQDVFSEAMDPKLLWRGDSVEIFVRHGDKAAQYVVIAPGLDGNPAHGLPRWQTIPESAQPLPPPHCEKTSQGYRVVARLPWSCFGPILGPGLGGETLGLGDELTIKLFVNQRQKGLPSRRLGWQADRDVGEKYHDEQLLRLSERAGVSSEFTGYATRGPAGTDAHAMISSLPEKAGREVVIRQGEDVIGRGRLMRNAEGTLSHVRIPLASPGQRQWGVLEMEAEGEKVGLLPVHLCAGDFLPPKEHELSYRGEGDSELSSVRATLVPLESLPGYFLHRVELTGLSEDRLYEFGPAGEKLALSFRTLPKTLKRPVTLVIGGDTLHKDQWLEASNRVALSVEPDLIVWGGDLADANGDKANRRLWIEWFGALRRSLVTDEGRVIPVIVGVGNHDVKKGYWYHHPGFQPDDEWRARIAPEFYELFAFPGQPGYGVLDLGDYASVFLLDTNHTNPVNGTQTRWLEAALAERGSVPHLIPVYHVGGYPSVKDFMGRTEQEVRENWPPLFEKYGVRSAFEHHNHAYKRTHPLRADRTHPDGVVYIGDGAWGVGAREPGEAPYLARTAGKRHVVAVHLDGEKQAITVLDEEGEVLDELRLERRAVPLRRATSSRGAAGKKGIFAGGGL